MIFQFIVFGLLIVGSISFTLFIRRLLVNASYKNERLYNIEKKLDAIMRKWRMIIFQNNDGSPASVKPNNTAPIIVK
nr:DUF4083 family protein [Bacillus sp. LL01]